jgi:leucyl aminopeptidase (aminopeptidase T)
MKKIAILLSIPLLFGIFAMVNAQMDSNSIAAIIIRALKLGPGERVLIRYDPAYMQDLVLPLREQIREAGAVDLGALEYVQDPARLETYPTDPAKRRTVAQVQMQAFEELLNTVDVYLWLATSKDRDLYSAEDAAIRNWLQKGGTRREIHFHWASGSMRADGLPDEHTADLDSLYRNALDIDYAALSDTQDHAIALLRSGTVHVTSPEGTDLTFVIGNRPFNKQNGDASIPRVQSARVFVDREIELPAGVIRVAPIEQSVQGKMVIPEARFGDVVVRKLQLQLKDGRITNISADENRQEVESQFSKVGDVAYRFREFGLGLNPALLIPPGSSVIPYYGYGAGIVRLSLGDNQELGGAVKGSFVRWFFCPNATVEVNGHLLVQAGKLLL